MTQKRESTGAPGQKEGRSTSDKNNPQKDSALLKKETSINVSYNKEEGDMDAEEIKSAILNEDPGYNKTLGGDESDVPAEEVQPDDEQTRIGFEDSTGLHDA